MNYKREITKNGLILSLSGLTLLLMAVYFLLKIVYFLNKSINEYMFIIIPFMAIITIFCYIFIIDRIAKLLYRKQINTPNYYLYNVIMAVGSAMAGSSKIIVTGCDVTKIDSPYLLLSNHPSFYDFKYINKIDPQRHKVFILNRHYFGLKFIGSWGYKCGFIPKKIFSSDYDTIKLSFKMRDKGFPIVMFPEGRMSSDGTINSINPRVADLALKLKMPVVLVKIRNAYLVKPKWRSKVFNNTVNVDVRKIITADELNYYSANSLFEEIKNELSFNDFTQNVMFKNNQRAKNLDGVLYMCPQCKAMFSTKSNNNNLKCCNCGKIYFVNKNYSFDDEKINNIHTYYSAIKDYEKQCLTDINLSVNVNVKIFNTNNNHYYNENGIFTLTDRGVSYFKDGKQVFFYSIDSLEGIAYSVNEEFELYHNNRLYYFYPEGDKRICTRLALIYDLLKEKNNG